MNCSPRITLKHLRFVEICAWHCRPLLVGALRMSHEHVGFEFVSWCLAIVSGIGCDGAILASSLPLMAALKSLIGSIEQVCGEVHTDETIPSL